MAVCYLRLKSFRSFLQAEYPLPSCVLRSPRWHPAANSSRTQQELPGALLPPLKRKPVQARRTFRLSATPSRSGRAPGGLEACARGHETVDGVTQRPCSSWPLFPQFDEYEVAFIDSGSGDIDSHRVNRRRRRASPSAPKARCQRQIEMSPQKPGCTFPSRCANLSDVPQRRSMGGPCF